MSETMRPERKRATLYVLLIFFCGALAGAVATNLWINEGPRIRRARADSSTSRSQRIVERYRRELRLSPQQTRQLNEILDETHKAYREHEMEIENLRQQGRDRIRQILDDQQRAKFEQMLAARDRKRRRHR